MEGYIKLYRKILDNPIVCKDMEHFIVWIYLLLNATHKEHDVVFKKERVTLKVGQLLTGRKTIGQKFNIDENKVQRILKYFENQHQIEQQMSNKNRLITIINWEEYQLERHQMEQQVNTNKNEKNIKNDKNNIPASKDKSSPAFAKASKHEYGEYKNVLLKDEELQRLKGEYQNWEELITYLDEYIEMKGYKAKSHYLCIKKWVVEAVKKKNNYTLQEETNKTQKKIQYEEIEYENEEDYKKKILEKG